MTTVRPLDKISPIQPHHSSSKPWDCRIASRLLHSIESKAFLKSSLSTFVTATKEIHSIYEVFGNAASMDEASLVRIHNCRNSRSDPVRQYFGEEFHWTVLKRDRPKRVHHACAIFFGQKNKVCTVEAIQIQGAIMETAKQM
ncbi:hypothetical protein SEVIR_3G359466v4 [Setaria viridis]